MAPTGSELRRVPRSVVACGRSKRVRSTTLLLAVSLTAATALTTAPSEAATSTIAFRSATSAGNGVGSALVVPAPAGTAAGDVLVAVVDAMHAPAVVPPPGWTRVRTDISSPSQLEQVIFVHAAGDSEPTAYRWTFAVPCGAVGSILAFSGVDTAAPIDGSSGRSVISALQLTAPSLTTTVDGAMLVAAYGVGGSRGVTPPIGMTERTLQILSNPPGEKVTGETASALAATAGPTRPISAGLALAGTGIGQLLALRPAQLSPTGTVTAYALTAGMRPSSIARGPNGDIWFTLHTSLARIAPATATVDYFSLPTPESVGNLTAAPDGNVWFTENTLNRIARIDPTTGAVTEFPIPTPGSGPGGIVVGADGNLWVAEVYANKIARVSLDGRIVEFRVPTAGAEPHGPSPGPDGNVWFAELAANKIARITPSGVVTEYALPTAASAPFVVTAGPDGNVWFTESHANKIGRITPTGTVTEFPLPTPNAGASGITAGPDGNVWFTEKQANKIGRITPAGAIHEWALPTAGSGPNKITAGPDGNLWFTEQDAGGIGRITP